MHKRLIKALTRQSLLDLRKEILAYGDQQYIRGCTTKNTSIPGLNKTREATKEVNILESQLLQRLSKIEEDIEKCLQ